MDKLVIWIITVSFLSILLISQVSWALPYDKIESDLISPNQTFQYTFTNTGTFEYHCQLHPWLRGIIEVDGSNPPINVVIKIPKGAVESTSKVSFEPNHVVIPSGSTVIWNNTDAFSHTVANIDIFPATLTEVKTIFAPITPLKQIKEGILAKDVKCKDHLILILKYDGSPACVMPKTKEKLLQREWVTFDNHLNNLGGEETTMFPSVIKTKATILTESSTLRIPLTMVTNSTIGSYADYNSHGMPEVIIDQSHILLSMYYGTIGGEDVIVANATNISSENVTLSSLNIGGFYPGPYKTPSYMGVLTSRVIGCTHAINYTNTSYPNGYNSTESIIVNGTMVSRNVTHYMEDSERNYIVPCEDPASTDIPVILAPGQSFAAYIKGNFMSGKIPIKIFIVGGAYYFGDEQHIFTISTPEQSIQ